MLFYTAYRGLFAAMNFSVLSHESSMVLLRAFVRGLRFDLWAVFWTHLPVLLTAFLPLRWQLRVDRLVYFYVALVNFIFTGFNVIDSELFKFAGKRVSREWFSLQQDVIGHGWSLVSYYWWLGSIGFLLWLLFIYLWPKFSKKAESLDSRAEQTRRAGLWQSAVQNIFFLLALVLGLRGGWQWKPLNLAHAFVEGSPVVGSLALNSTISLLKSSNKIESLALHFLTDDERAQVLARHSSSPSSYFARAKDFNVVILIVESLSLEYLGRDASASGYFPLLKKRTGQALFFAENFANGRRSIEAVPSVICGLPSLMSEAFILSPYQSINLNCLGQMAGHYGYTSLFFHGAHNGSMHFDSFAQRAGFNKYYGYDEFPDAGQSDGQWGIFDEPFLQFAREKLAEVSHPFVATIFTLSSHHPYRIPDQYKGQFPKGNLEIHESLGYVDLAIERFFAAAEKEPWFNKTLFFITGDHTAKSQDPQYQDLLGVYRVPLILYSPGLRLEAKVSKVTQHADILPTIRELLGWSDFSDLPFGRSVFSREGAAINATAQGFWLYTESGLVQYIDATKTFLDESKFEKPTAELWLKALIDEFNQGLIHNQLVRSQKN